MHGTTTADGRVGTTRPGDTTAEILRRLRLSPEPRDLTALGVALHHFTELADDVELDVVTLHCATTILTKQVADRLRGPAPWPAIRRLVTDPHRVATPDGATVEVLCSSTWASIRHQAGRRATAAVEGVARFGADAVTRLASLRGHQSTAPWWGTEAFEHRIDAWLGDARLSPVLAASLRRAPEQAPADVLHDILCG